jgi:hypothetical protein
MKGFNISMRIKYGRGLIGQTPTTALTNIRARNISVCASMNRNSMLYKMINTRAFNIADFSSFINNLCLYLRERDMNNCVFILDNVAFHRNISIRDLVTQNGTYYIFFHHTHLH